MQRVTICLVFLAFAAQGALAQSVPQLGAQPPSVSGVPQAPVGHRQPTPGDLPPAVQKEEQPNALDNPQPQSQSQPETPSHPQSRSQSRTAQGRGGGGGPPTLQVGPSCEAAGRGAVVLGRNKEACLADENAALSTLRQNWSKYAANDKTLCIGMEFDRRPRKLCRAPVLSRDQQGCARDPKRGSAGGGPRRLGEHDRRGKRRHAETQKAKVARSSRCTP